MSFYKDAWCISTLSDNTAAFGLGNGSIAIYDFQDVNFEGAEQPQPNRHIRSPQLTDTIIDLTSQQDGTIIACRYEKEDIAIIKYRNRSQNNVLVETIKTQDAVSVATLSDDTIISGHTNGDIKIWKPTKSILHYILCRELEKCLERNKTAQLHKDWIELFKTLPDSLQKKFERTIKNKK